MIPSRPEINYLVGGVGGDSSPLVPFGDLQNEFLNTLSDHLRKSPEANRYPDVLTYAFWCRKGNILRLRDEMKDGRYRLGLGNVFHIAPSNVPVNFAFSYAFGLLAGNVNYVRVPSKNFPQVDIICESIKAVLEKPEYRDLQPYSHFFRYGHQKEITDEISARCQGRLIWGGDTSIREIRKSLLPIRAVDIAFADRYSICCLGAKGLLAISDSDLERLATGFYNDTYLMDQNACSSPHLVVWLGTEPAVEQAKERFWSALGRMVHQKYELSFKAAVDKYTLFCENAIELKDIEKVAIKDTSLFRIDLRSLPSNIESIRGHSGYFYEYTTDNLDTIAKIITPVYQTLTYAGVEKQILIDFVIKNRLGGIDRIVSVGRALEMGIVWDGQNMIQSLSRIIDV